MPSDLTPDAKLTRTQVASELTKAGYKIAPSTLATKATRGGGPPFQYWCQKPIYTWGTSLEWAKALMTTPVSTTSEAGRYRPVPRRNSSAV